ncbi:MAG TPA: hypothetical protein VL053_18470, partial [Arachidicoccus sp.]|nr:hypothetical protein [Arachidicoccus sp.]
MAIGIQQYQTLQQGQKSLMHWSIFKSPIIMKRINIRIVIYFLLISLMSANCGQNTQNSYSNDKYQKYKNHFDVEYTKHFPQKLKIENSKEKNAVFSSMDSVKNDFSLLLYEYGVNSEDIKGVLDKVAKNIIAQYKSS